jgi:hypothetical protein
MRINRNNYEAFLLDLSEGNLSDEMQLELSLFLASHPDLDANLIDEFISIEGDTEVRFDKDLLRFDTINQSNRKHLFAAYHEGDLNESQKAEILDFVSQNSNLKQEFDQFSKLTLKPSNTIFEDKKTLHSIAGNEKSRGIIYWSTRIAAVFIIGFILNTLYQGSNNITPKYALERGILDFKPIIQKGEPLELISSKTIINKSSINKTPSIANNSNFKDSKSQKSKDLPKNEKANKDVANFNLDPVKNQAVILKRNPSLNKVIASLNSREETLEIEKPQQDKNYSTPPSILAFIEDRAKKKNILTENGRPNIISLLNKGSKSLTGQNVVAQNETEKSNETIFQLGSLKIQRITSK